MKEFQQLKNQYITEYDNGKYTDALKTINKMKKIRPNNAEVYINTAKLYEDGFRELKKAIFYRKKAFKLDNKNYININKMGDVYYRLGDKKRAENMWEEGMKLKDYICTINLGELKFYSGKYEEAIYIFENAVNLARENIYAYYMIARTKGEHLGKPKEAIGICEYLIEQKPNNENMKYKMAVLKQKSRWGCTECVA